jgi:hypothetical protein
VVVDDRILVQDQYMRRVIGRDVCNEKLLRRVRERVWLWFSLFGLGGWYIVLRFSGQSRTIPQLKLSLLVLQVMLHQCRLLTGAPFRLRRMTRDVSENTNSLALYAVWNLVDTIDRKGSKRPSIVS